MKFSPDTSSEKSQSGNALWFILVAIVLLGALTVLLSRSGTSVNQSGDVEQNRIKIGQMIRWAKGLEGAIEQMKLRGISENQLSFQNGETSVDYTNPSCTVNDCKIFAMGGGGQTYMRPPAGISTTTDWSFTGTNGAGNTNPIGTADARTGNDLMLILRPVNDAACKQINKEFGIGTSGTIPDETNDIEYLPYQGSFPSYILTITGTSGETEGKNSGCVYNTASMENVFYYVLLAR